MLLFQRRAKKKSTQKIWFSHILKTGGTTLVEILKDVFPVSKISTTHLGARLILSQYSFQEIKNFNLIAGHYSYSFLRRFAPDNAVSLIFLREPIARLYSSYSHQKRACPNFFSEGSGFLDFVDGQIKNLEDGCFFEETNIYTHNLTYKWENPPSDFEKLRQQSNRKSIQKLRLYKANPDLENVAKCRINSYSFIGITERYQESLQLLCYSLNICPRLIESYSSLNTNPNRVSIHDVLTSDELNYISELNKNDTEVYNYASQLFNTRYSAMLSDLRRHYGKDGEANVQELLSRRYNRIYKNIYTPQRTYDYTFDQPLAGKGWQTREGPDTAGQYFRWTGPATTSTLELPLYKGRNLHIKIHIINAVDVEVIENIKLFVHDHEIPYLPITFPANKLFRLLYAEIPKDALADTRNPFVTLTLQLPWTATLRSRNPDIPDDRPVGVAVQRVDIWS